MERVRLEWGRYVDSSLPIRMEFGTHISDADFYVHIGRDLCFHIRDQIHRELSHLPILRADHPDTTQKLMQLIEHLHSFQIVSRLKSRSGPQPPRYKFDITEEAKNDEDDECESSWRVQFKNMHSSVLYISLNLTPLHGVYPLHDPDWASLEIDPGAEMTGLIIDIRIPDLLKPLAARQGFKMRDVIKLIVTTAKSDFLCFELSDLGDSGMFGSGKLRQAVVRRPAAAKWFVDEREIATVA